LTLTLPRCNARTRDDQFELMHQPIIFLHTTGFSAAYICGHRAYGDRTLTDHPDDQLQLPLFGSRVTEFFSSPLGRHDALNVPDRPDLEEMQVVSSFK
jgi:hypothetical protein